MMKTLGSDRRAKVSRSAQFRDAEKRDRRSSVRSVPELTRNAGINLNARVSLLRAFEILSCMKSCGLARRLSPPPGHAYRAIGVVAEQAAAPPKFLRSELMVILPDVRSVENILSPFVKFHDERADDGDKCKKQSYFDKHHKPPPIGGHYSPLSEVRFTKSQLWTTSQINAMWGISAALRVGALIRARRLNVPISPIGIFRKLTSMDVWLGATASQSSICQGAKARLIHH